MTTEDLIKGLIGAVSTLLIAATSALIKTHYQTLKNSLDLNGLGFRVRDAEWERYKRDLQWMVDHDVKADRERYMDRCLLGKPR